MNLVQFEGKSTSIPLEDIKRAEIKVGSMMPYHPIESMEGIMPLIIMDIMRDPLIDEWEVSPEDNIFKHVDKAIILPVCNYYGLDPEKYGSLDLFILSPKRCYNKPDTRAHISKYLNYFEKFYDVNHELVAIYFQLKHTIDFNMDYDKNNFIYDLKKYILFNRSIIDNVYMMTEYNHIIELKAKKGKSISSLQYNSKHGKLLMQMSLLMCMVIPLITHFACMRKIDNIDELLLCIFDEILNMSDVDMYGKLYETVSTEVRKNESLHSLLWSMQAIRGKNPTVHSMSTIENIMLNIMPKYTYDRNIISFNFSSIRKSNRFKITNIKYEYTFIQLSSSMRDEDFNSEFDKYESYVIRQDEGLYLQNKCACQGTMEMVERAFGPFDPKEIDFYMSVLEEGGTNVINEFQMELIFNLFYKYFGDVQSIKNINNIDYIKLMISAKRILEAYNMIILPYIISSKVINISNRKSINKKELMKITSSPYWKQIQEKYRNPKIEEMILEQIGTILSSEFKMIDYYDDAIDGKTLECIMGDVKDIISEEYLIYVLMI